MFQRSSAALIIMLSLAVFASPRSASATADPCMMLTMKQGRTHIAFIDAPVPPTVTSTSPINGAQGVALGSTITANFSASMNNMTICGITFDVRGSNGTYAVGSYTFGAQSATLTPTVPLTANLVYTATVHATVADMLGNQMGVDRSWNFITGYSGSAPHDNDAPFVMSTNPGSDASGVAQNANIAINFNESLDANTVLNPAAISVTANDVVVSGVTTYSSATNQAVFTPAAALPYGAVVHVIVHSSITDLVGNGLTKVLGSLTPYEFGFTVVAAPPVQKDETKHENVTTESTTDQGHTTPKTNRLVKMHCEPAHDENDPCTTIYYVDAVAVRHAFPNPGTYHSWYKGYEGIEEITVADMNAYQVGKTVSYQPGVKMLKTRESAVVYVIEKQRTIRAIANETVAQAMYGASWASLVEDISQTLLAAYDSGAQITLASQFNKEEQSNNPGGVADNVK